VVMTERRLLTVPEVADELRVTEGTIREWLRLGKLKGTRPGGTKAGWRVAREDLDRFVEAGRPRDQERAG